MSYTLLELRTRIRDISNDKDATTIPYFVSDAQLNRWINDAERDIAKKALCINNIDSLTTTASTRAVAFSGHRVVYLEHLISATEGIGLKKIHPLHAGRQRQEGESPQKWFESGSNVYVEPILVAASNLKAYVADFPSAEMSSDAHTPKIPDEYQLLIILYAFEKVLHKEKRYGQAAQIKSIYENELFHTYLDKTAIIPDSYDEIENGRE